MISAKHVASGREQTRHMLAVGEEFEGRFCYLDSWCITELIHHKGRNSMHPHGLFVGWRYSDGPKSHLGVYLVLDYAKVKNRESGFANSIAIPAE